MAPAELRLAAYLLLFSAVPACGVRPQGSEEKVSAVDTEQDVLNDMPQLLPLRQVTNSTESVVVCHDLCIVCADGKQAVLVRRASHKFKAIAGFVLAPAAVVGLAFAPLTAVVAGGAYYLLDKQYAEKLGPECPNLQVIHFDAPLDIHNKVQATSFDEDVKTQLADKNSQLQLLTKSIDKMWAEEQKFKREAAGVKDSLGAKMWNSAVSSRPAGAVTDLMMSSFDESALICANHGGVMKKATGPVIKEQGSLQGMWHATAGAFQRLTDKSKEDKDIGFANTCKEFHAIQR